MLPTDDRQSHQSSAFATEFAYLAPEPLELPLDPEEPPLMPDDPLEPDEPEPLIPEPVPPLAPEVPALPPPRLQPTIVMLSAATTSKTFDAFIKGFIFLPFKKVRAGYVLDRGTFNKFFRFPQCGSADHKAKSHIVDRHWLANGDK